VIISHLPSHRVSCVVPCVSCAVYCVHVASGYPHSPPICKVTPTEVRTTSAYGSGRRKALTNILSLETRAQTMVVKTNHKHVDSGGVCYHPYLSGTQPLLILIFIFIMLTLALQGGGRMCVRWWARRTS